MIVVRTCLESSRLFPVECLRPGLTLHREVFLSTHTHLADTEARALGCFFLWRERSIQVEQGALSHRTCVS